MGDISQIKLPDNTTYDLKDNNAYHPSDTAQSAYTAINEGDYVPTYTTGSAKKKFTLKNLYDWIFSKLPTISKDTKGLAPKGAAVSTQSQSTKFLREDGSWAAPSYTSQYSLPLAANGTRGGVQIGYTQSGKNYPVELSDEKMYVNVPWTDVNNGTITITQNGTSVGDFSMNQSGDETIALTDEKVKITSTNPTSTTTYYPTWVDSSGTKGENINNGFAYQSRNGTTSQDGVAVVQAGNAIASGTENNKKGYFRVYNKNSNFASIGYNDSATSDTTHTLPATGGTIVNNNTFRSQATVTTTENGLMIAADKSKLNTLTQNFRGIVTVEAADSFIAGWRRFAKITASGNYGSALLTFRGGWTNNAPFVGTVLYTIRNNEAKLRILNGFCSANGVHQKLRAARISANNYYLEMYRSATSNANSAQYCDIVPISGTQNWTVTETSDTPPINNNAKGVYDYEISLLDEQFIPHQTNTGYIGTADKAWKEGYINNLHGDVDGSATKLTKTETVLQTNQVPYVSRASLSPEGFSGYIREMLVGGSVAWNQLVVNGNFASTSNWGTTGTGTTISASDNVLTVSSTTDGNMYSSQTFTAKTVTGHKYIFNAEAYSDYTSNLIIVYRGGGDANRIEFTNTETGKYVKYNAIFDCTNQSVMSQIRLLNRQHSSSNKFKNVYIVDLTLMLGATIADYLYNLESSTAGAGVSLLRSLGFFTDPYYAQDNGSIQNVCVKEKKITGFNQWDEVWELGGISGTDGTNSSATDRIRSKNYIHVLPNQTYYFCYLDSRSAQFYVCHYDANKNFIDRVAISKNTTETIPSNCYYIRFFVYSATAITTYANDVCVNVSDTSKNGTYEPYHVDTIPLSASELRGIALKDASNNLYFDGDEYTSDGKIKRKYGIVDLGTITWSLGTNNRFTSETISTLKNVSAWNSAKSVCAKYKQATVSSSGTNEDKIYGIYGQKVYVNDTAYTDAATFKAAMDGVYLVYELAEPTEETALSYQNPQYAKGGTEEFVDGKTRDMIVPVGHVTEYMGATAGEYQFMPTMPVDDGNFGLYSDNNEIIWKEDSYTRITKSGISPIVNNALLGKPEQRWNYIYCNNIYCDSIGNINELTTDYFNWNKYILHSFDSTSTSLVSIDGYGTIIMEIYNTSDIIAPIYQEFDISYLRQIAFTNGYVYIPAVSLDHVTPACFRITLIEDLADILIDPTSACFFYNGTAITDLKIVIIGRH